jgi:DNA-directed RNA polymerase subunit F
MSLDRMTIAEFMAHTEHLSDKERNHQLAWAVLREQFRLEEVEDPTGSIRTHVAIMRRADWEARTSREMRSLLMSAKLADYALSDDELRQVFLDVYHFRYYLAYRDLEKRTWNEFVGDLFRLLDPKGLTRRGRSADGDVEARLGSLWTEEAAHLVLRLNRLMDLDPPARGPGSILTDSLELAKAEAMAPVLKAYTDKELEELESHCALCHVKLFSALEPERRQRLIEATVH